MAYSFPLDAFSRGGRPTDDELAQEDVSEENEDEQQQRLDDLDDGEGRTETWGNESAGDGESSSKG